MSAAHALLVQAAEHVYANLLRARSDFQLVIIPCGYIERACARKHVK